MKRHFLALLLSLTMIISLLPVTAMADNEEQTPQETTVEEPEEETAKEPQAVTQSDPAEPEEDSTISISSADQIYALARILGDKAEEGDYTLLGVEDTMSKADLQSASYVLTQSIALTNHNEDDTSNGFYGIPDFKGTFDGKGKTITLDINFSAYENTANCGVFQNLDGATVKNIKLNGKAEGTLTLSAGLNNVGLLVGYVGGSSAATIENIETSVKATFTMLNNGHTAYFGEVLGRNGLGQSIELAVTNCVNNADITVAVEGELSNPSRVAGLIGHTNAGAVMDGCRNNGDITVTGDTTTVGGLTGSFNGAIYQNCVEAGSLSSPKSAARLFADMKNTTTKADGNYIELTVNGTDGQTITAADGISAVVEDGTATLELPVYFVNSNTRRYEKYNLDEAIQVDGGASLYLFDVTSRNAALTLDTANATDEELPFGSWETAIHLSSADDLIDLQNAVNIGDPTAIAALYAKGGVDVPDDLATAQIVLRSAYYVLDEDDVELSKDFTGIGTGVNSFGGHFDGQGNTVTLTISATASATDNTNYYGFFGMMVPLTDGVVELKNLNVETTIDLELPAAISYSAYAGGVAGYVNRLTVDNVTVNTKKIAAKSEDTTDIQVVHIGGAFGFESILIGGTVDTTVSGPITADWSGTRYARLGGFAGQGRTGGSVTFENGASIQANAVVGSVGGIMGYSWAENDFTGMTVKNMSETPVTLGGTRADNQIRTGLLIGDHTTTGIQTDEVGVKIDGFKPEGKFDLNGFSVGGLIGLLQTNGIVEIKNSAANVGNVTYEKQMGGLIGTCWTSQTVYQISDTAYVKATDGLKTLGSPAKMIDGAVELDVTKIDGGIFGDAEENVLSEAAPAALTVSANAKLDGTSLIYTKADENSQDIIFYWNGTELCRKTVTVTAKPMTGKTVEIVGVSSSYASNDAAAADLNDVRVIYNGTELVKGTDYEISAASVDDAKGQFTITFKGNYSGTKTQDYALNGDFTATADSLTVTYDGKEHSIEVKTNPADGVTVQYKTSSEAEYSDAAVTLTDVGTVTVYWQATKDGSTPITGSAVLTITKATQDISYATKSVSKRIGAANFTNKLTVNENKTFGEITYESSNESVAKVDAATGEVTIVGVGTAVITATAAGSDNYDAASASYTLTVSHRASAPSATTPEPEPEPDDGLPFTDVPKSAYFYDAVEWAVGKEITDGMSATMFGPYESCTRAQIVTFLWRAAGSPEPKAASSFTDVPASAYYAKAVAWAVENGITNGTSATEFSPNATCTRGQSVTFLYRALGKKVESSTNFTDVASDAFYADAVNWAVANNVTNGTSATTFSPNADCTRAEIVTFLYRAYQGK